MKKCVVFGLTIALLAWPVTVLGDVQRGDQGEEVRELQQLLWQCGWIFEEPDGMFGGRTEEALRNYQAYAGFPVNGVADEAVFAQLRADWERLSAELQEDFDEEADWEPGDNGTDAGWEFGDAGADTAWEPDGTGEEITWNDGGMDYGSVQDWPDPMQDAWGAVPEDPSFLDSYSDFPFCETYVYYDIQQTHFCSAHITLQWQTLRAMQAGELVGLQHVAEYWEAVIDACYQDWIAGELNENKPYVAMAQVSWNAWAQKQREVLNLLYPQDPVSVELQMIRMEKAQATLLCQIRGYMDPEEYRGDLDFSFEAEDVDWSDTQAYKDTDSYEVPDEEMESQPLSDGNGNPYCRSWTEFVEMDLVQACEDHEELMERGYRLSLTGAGLKERKALENDWESALDALYDQWASPWASSRTQEESIEIYEAKTSFYIALEAQDAAMPWVIEDQVVDWRTQVVRNECMRLCEFLASAS